MIKEYIKKEQKVKAVFWNGNNNGEVFDICRRCYMMGDEIIIKNNNGDLRVKLNSYIVEEVNGEFNCYSVEDFIKLYKEI